MPSRGLISLTVGCFALATAACGNPATNGASAPTPASADSAERQTMTVAIKGVPSGGQLQIRDIYLADAVTGAQLHLYQCVSQDCSVDMTRDQNLVLNAPIDASAQGRLYATTSKDPASASSPVEITPVMASSWFTRDGVYVLPASMGYQQMLSISFDGTNWSYDASVDH